LPFTQMLETVKQHPEAGSPMINDWSVMSWT